MTRISGVEFPILNRVVRGDLAEKVTFAQRIKGIDGYSHIII